MAISQLSICNAALINVGALRISAITEENKRAILLNAIYEQTRDAMLRLHPWSFATMRATLTPTAAEPDWGYEYEYDLPTDYLGFMRTDPSSIDYVIEDDKLRSDESTLGVLYTYRNVDESSYDPAFAEAFAWKLSCAIAYNLTQSVTLAESCEKRFEREVSKARYANGVEDPTPSFEADDWTNARRR